MSEATQLEIEAPKPPSFPIEFTHTRVDLLLYLCEHFKYQKYLEIGTQENWCFNQINTPLKIGVDPVSGGTHRMTSDEFFHANTQKFDLIFIDGLHHHDQVYRDVINGLNVLEPGGTIVLHDCMPPREIDEIQTRCGTAWRAMAHFREDPSLDSAVGLFDYGVGVIKVRQNDDPIVLPRPFDELTYEELQENWETWMRPHSFEELKLFATKT